MFSVCFCVLRCLQVMFRWFWDVYEDGEVPWRGVRTSCLSSLSSSFSLFGNLLKDLLRGLLRHLLLHCFELLGQAQPFEPLLFWQVRLEVSVGVAALAALAWWFVLEEFRCQHSLPHLSLRLNPLIRQESDLFILSAFLFTTKVSPIHANTSYLCLLLYQYCLLFDISYFYEGR